MLIFSILRHSPVWVSANPLRLLGHRLSLATQDKDKARRRQTRESQGGPMFLVWTIKPTKLRAQMINNTFASRQSSQVVKVFQVTFQKLHFVPNATWSQTQLFIHSRELLFHFQVSVISSHHFIFANINWNCICIFFA